MARMSAASVTKLPSPAPTAKTRMTPKYVRAASSDLRSCEWRYSPSASRHLHGADEGDQGVGQRVDAVRQEADDEQKRDLLDQDQLPPVQLPEIAEAHVDELRRHRPEYEGQNRDQIFQAHGPVAP